MGRNISIAISAKDNFTQAITTMRNANSSFNKDLTGTSQKLDALNKNRITLKVDTDKAKSALKDAEKQFSATGSAADKMAMELASANYDNAKRNIDLVSKNAKQAEKDILNMTGAISKADNRAGSGKSSGTAMLNTLAKAGFTKMAGDTVSSLANTAISSAFGSEAGKMFGSTLSGAASGAAMGSLAGPVGTVIGGAVGAGLGAINGGIESFKNKDEAFKSVVQDSYNGIKQTQADTLSSGSTIAGNRERDQISFTTMLGSNDDAKDFLSNITEFANKTPFEYDQLTKLSKTLLVYGYKQNQIIPLLTKVGDAGSALGMGAEDMDDVATNLGRMKITGKTTERYLNPLLQRGIDVWGSLSRASGKTEKQVQDMVSKGLVPGAEAAEAIADYMGDAYKNSMDLQSKSYPGLQSTLEDAQKELSNAMGTGHNEVRKKGMQKEINFLSGESGKQLEEANKMAGKFQASLENTKNELLMDAQKSVVSGMVTGDWKNEDNKKRLQQLADDYKIAKPKGDKGDEEAAAKAGRDIEEAKVIAANEYKASDGYKLQLESDLSLAASIRDDTALNTAYYDAGYKMGQQFSTGIVKGYQSDKAKGLHPYGPFLSGLAGMAGVSSTGKSSGLAGMAGVPNKSHQSGLAGMAGVSSTGKSSGLATGIFRVPYNDYPALLHEGETVSTAVEARSKQNWSGVKVEISGPVTVRQESDIDAIASVLAQKLQRAATAS